MKVWILSFLTHFLSSIYLKNSLKYNSLKLRGNSGSRSFSLHLYIVYMVQNVSRMMEYYLRQSSGLIQAILELSWWSKSSYHNLALETTGYKRSIFGVFYSLMSIFLMNSMYRNKNVIVWQPLLVSEVTTNEFWCLRDVVIASNNIMKKTKKN